MGSYEEFAVSGPTHMMANSRGSSPVKMIEIDWDNEEHRRCITACLVKGTYVMESDQTKVRLDRSEALAPAWWESFHCRRLKVLKCECKCVCCKIFGPSTWFIYGAVFEYMPPEGARRHPSAPRYIVAFRGTMPRDPTIFGDMRLNLRILLNKQRCCGRFGEASKVVGELVDSIRNSGAAGDSDVWLAGHSLGASIALDVGRDMMSEGSNLPTFLFNPPHVSLAPAADKLGMPEKAKRDLYLTNTFLKYAMGKTILRPQKKHMDALFKQLSPWVPELYVHERDIICSGFIDHFELREQAQERCPSISRSAATLAYRDMLHPCAVSGFGDKKGRQHLLPSARLWKNSSSDSNAHELRQWWQPELMLTSNQYGWP